MLLGTKKGVVSEVTTPSKTARVNTIVTIYLNTTFSWEQVTVPTSY